MNVPGINASPRKNGNPQTLVEAVLQGAAAKGADTRLIYFIVSCGDPEPPSLFAQFYGHLDEWLQLIPLTLGAGHHQIVHQFGADIDRRAASQDRALLEKARQAGAGLLV